MSISVIDGSENSQVSANYAPDESRIIEQSQQADFIDSLMISKDKDGDGILDLDESGLRKKEFSKYDVDGNGRISVAEVQAKLEQLQQQKGDIGKLDVEMQQAENSAAKMPNAGPQKMVTLEDSGLDERTFNMLDSDGDGKVSQAEIDSLRDAEERVQEGSLFSEALSEFQKNFFQKEKDDEEKDLNGDGVVSEEEEEKAKQQAAQVTGVNAEESKEPATNTEPQGKRFSARQMAGVRAYQNQASEFFAAASNSSVSFQY
ncbi:hypothetical protein [Maridesulfovibrio sp.]|uniref:hypothetical protein n=1 Tax=Maridesulfovibrio sp. TaxID=2795000 RepID=UPI002A188C9C|nr:hypothetical protein [Maridesulfovibrio sp.]